MDSLPDSETSDDKRLSPVDHLRRLLPEMAQRPAAASVNRDSLVYLARYSKAEVNNPFWASGAMRRCGASGSQLREIVEFLAVFAHGHQSPESFPELAAQRFNLTVIATFPFPASPRARTIEDDRQEAEALERWRRESEVSRAIAEQDQIIDAHLARNASIEVRAIPNQWGWQRVDDGELFSPTSDPSLAFDLIHRFRLDISFMLNDVAVSYKDELGMRGTVFGSNCAQSLTRAVATAAWRASLYKTSTK